MDFFTGKFKKNKINEEKGESGIRANLAWQGDFKDHHQLRFHFDLFFLLWCWLVLPYSYSFIWFLDLDVTVIRYRDQNPYFSLAIF